MEELGVKIQTPYSMMLVEIGMLPLEGEALCQFIPYIIKINNRNRNKLPMQTKIASQDKGLYHDRMKWIKKWEIEKDELLNEPLAIQDLVQKRVREKLWKEPSEKIRFYQREINPIDYFHRTTIPPRENIYA